MKILDKFYKNKTILVTGGCGSIGSEIVRKLIKCNPHSIRIFDNNESGLYDLDHELKSKKVRPLVGDVRDKDRLKKAVEDVDIVFHAAALKHVPLCEYNPFEAVKTNILGTENIIETCLEEEVDKLIFISTDKAVNPTNVMGATKLLAERFTVSSNYFKGSRKTALSCVRFGNVLDSRGSVIPLFKKQIKEGGPVTVTDPKMTRFFMSIPKAVELVLMAAEMARGGEIFILKMPTIKIGDLAESAVSYFAPKYGYNKKQIKIKNIGKRSGEKTHEELISNLDSENTYETKNMYIILPPNLKTEKLTYNIADKIKTNNLKKVKNPIYSSDNKKNLTKKEIINLLKKDYKN